LSALRPKKKKSPDLRPLTSRALTSIIDTLRPNLPESKVLDLYSGKGRFGITALCEKAASVIFVERDKKNAEEIRKNLLKSPGKNHVYTMDVNPYLEKAKKEGELFDILFADPPFRLWKENFAEDLVAAVSGGFSGPVAFFLCDTQREC